MSLAQAGKEKSYETKQNMSLAQQNRSPEVKDRMSKAQIGKHSSITDEVRDKIVKANKGKTLSEEHKAILSQSKKAYWARKKAANAI